MKDGVEFVSPILNANSKWRGQLDRLWERLHELCYLKQGKSCGLHIHISCRSGFNLGMVKNIAKAILHLQPTIDQNFPDQNRVNNSFCQSNSCGLEELKGAKGLD